MTGVTGADGGVRMSRGIYSTTDEVREHLTAKQQRREGKLARACQPFERLATFHPVDRDPVALLAEQNRTRLPDLIGLRWQRMAASAFTFYRGSARLMAHDLAAQEDTGQQIVICGDAHISNFGLFASPERRLVFDLNDFDEAAPGPWEWDVRRLVTSVVLGARRRVRRRGGQPPRAADCAGLPAGDTEAVALVGARPLLRERRRRHDRRPDAQLVGQGVPAGGGQGPLAHGGAGGAADDGAGRDGRAPLCRAAARAPARHRVTADALRELFHGYLASVRPDLRMLVRSHRLVDGARRVVGVGSVGTRCYVVLLLDANDNPLVLQLKEAGRSVVTEANRPNASTPETLRADEHDGRRVVDHQRILQAVSDPFLGWASVNGHDFYIRQFRDMKGSVNLSRLSPRTFEEYVVACGLLLGRAHAQSRALHWIAGYLGKGVGFDRAMTDWALAYADQVERDFARFVRAAPWG